MIKDWSWGQGEGGGHPKPRRAAGAARGEPRAAQGVAGRTAQGQTPGFTVTGGDPTVPANTRKQEKACLNVKEKTGGTKLRKIPGKGLGMWYIAASLSIGLVPSLSLSFTGALFPQISLHHSQLNIKPQTKAYLSCFHMTHHVQLATKMTRHAKSQKKKKDHQSETILKWKMLTEKRKSSDTMPSSPLPLPAQKKKEREKEARRTQERDGKNKTTTK